MKTRIPAAVLAFVLAAAGSLAFAQPKPACAAGKTGKPAAITAKEAWDLASTRARAWQDDAVPFDLTTTSTGPLDAAVKSTDWDVKFSSAKARAVDMISISDGSIRCFTIAGEGGQVIHFDDRIILDTKRLYDIAQKAGGEKVGAGASVMAGLVPREEGHFDRRAGTRNYQDAGGKEVLSVVIDARTGRSRNVFRIVD
jgi:hypothetical protein